MKRLILSLTLAAAIACTGVAAAQTGPRLAQKPTAIAAVLPQGILRIEVGAVAALVLSPGDTVFVQAATPDTLILWNNDRTLAGVSGVTYTEGDVMPQPDDRPVLCVHSGEFCVIFVASNRRELAAGVTYRPKARA